MLDFSKTTTRPHTAPIPPKAAWSGGRVSGSDAREAGLVRRLPDQHPDRRRIETRARIVRLRTVRDDGKGVHLRPQIDEVAGLREALEEYRVRQLPVLADGDVREEV